MTKKEIRQIYKELREEMTSAEFLSASGLQKETVEMVLNREYWEVQIASLFPIVERFTCRRLFEICRATMFLLGREPEEGWLSFTYKYACHILYPEKEFTEKYSEYSAGALYYLNVLRFFFDKEREALPFEPLKDFAFLSEEEYRQSENAEEYRRFLKYWHREYIYEMMRLNSEVTKFKTLEHISGVHYVAMTIARGSMPPARPWTWHWSPARRRPMTWASSAASRMRRCRSCTITTPHCGPKAITFPTSATSRRTIPPGTWSLKTCLWSLSA